MLEVYKQEKKAGSSQREFIFPLHFSVNIDVLFVPEKSGGKL